MASTLAEQIEAVRALWQAKLPPAHRERGILDEVRWIVEQKGVTEAKRIGVAPGRLAWEQINRPASGKTTGVVPLKDLLAAAIAACGLAHTKPSRSVARSAV